MQVPKLEKITLNIGLGEAKENSKLMDTAIEELKLITELILLFRLKRIVT